MFANKKVLIIGAARSGLAAAKLLRHLDAEVVVNEYKDKNSFNEYQELINLGVSVVCGEHPKELFEEDFDFVIKNPGIKYTLWFIERLQERNIPIYSEIELAFQVAKKQHYVAITGTNGKTTTTSLVYEIIKNKYPKITHTAGNIGRPLCEVVLEENLFDNENHYIILELSNFQLLNIQTFKPAISTIINLTPDHLDYMRSLEEYYYSKTNIYMNQDEHDLFLLNIDDVEIINYTNKRKPNAQIIRFSLEDENADFYLKNDCVYHNNQCLLDTKQINIVGMHNIQNCIIALIIALKLGVDLEMIQEVMYRFVGVEHRIEFVRELDGVRYYNDSKATNVDATMIALKAFDSSIILLIGGFEKRLDVSSLLPYMDKVKLVIGYGDCGQRLVDDLKVRSKVVTTLKEAVTYAKNNAVVNDIVLLSPTTSSYDQFDNYEQRGSCFKELVNSL